jgi:hypothetical protein
VPLVAVLIVTGLQVPPIPFVDVPGNEGATLFWHNGPIAVKFGVSCGLTVIFIVVADAHCPTVGVNV